MLFIMSIRMCSFDSSVQDEQRRNTAPNRTHCSSNHELDETLNTFRAVALMALTRMAASKPQATICPRRVLNRSTIRLNLSKASKCFLPDMDLTCLAAAIAAREGRKTLAGAKVGERPTRFGIS